MKFKSLFELAKYIETHPNADYCGNGDLARMHAATLREVAKFIRESNLVITSFPDEERRG